MIIPIYYGKKNVPNHQPVYVLWARVHGSHSGFPDVDRTIVCYSLVIPHVENPPGARWATPTAQQVLASKGLESQLEVEDLYWE